MAEFDNAIALALRMIEQKGRPISVRTFSENAPADPDAPWNPAAPTEINEPTTGVFLTSLRSFVTGEVFQSVTALFLIAAGDLAADPTPKGYIVDGSTLWSVTSVATLQPNEQKVLHEVRVSL